MTCGCFSFSSVLFSFQQNNVLRACNSTYDSDNDFSTMDREKAPIVSPCRHPMFLELWWIHWLRALSLGWRRMWRFPCSLGCCVAKLLRELVSMETWSQTISLAVTCPRKTTTHQSWRLRWNSTRQWCHVRPLESSNPCLTRSKQGAIYMVSWCTKACSSKVFGLMSAVWSRPAEEFEEEDTEGMALYKGSFSLTDGTQQLKCKRFYGLLGPNECGKTTLIGAMVNEQLQGFSKCDELKSIFVEYETRRLACRTTTSLSWAWTSRAGAGWCPPATRFTSWRPRWRRSSARSSWRALASDTQAARTARRTWSCPRRTTRVDGRWRCSCARLSWWISMCLCVISPLVTWTWIISGGSRTGSWRSSRVMRIRTFWSRWARRSWWSAKMRAMRRWLASRPSSSHSLVLRNILVISRSSLPATRRSTSWAEAWWWRLCWLRRRGRTLSCWSWMSPCTTWTVKVSVPWSWPSVTTKAACWSSLTTRGSALAFRRRSVVRWDLFDVSKRQIPETGYPELSGTQCQLQAAAAGQPNGREWFEWAWVPRWRWYMVPYQGDVLEAKLLAELSGKVSGKV